MYFQVKGVKSLSAFVALPHFDIGKGFVVDWMHAILLGVMKSLHSTWTSSQNRNEPFYLGLKVCFVSCPI